MGLSGEGAWVESGPKLEDLQALQHHPCFDSGLKLSMEKTSGKGEPNEPRMKREEQL